MRRKSRTGSSPSSPQPSTRRLIDGYNLLFAVGFGNLGTPAAKLPAARQELFDFLTRVLDESERRSTVIVFDAKRAPYGNAATQYFAHMTIHFAVDYRDADELLIELIRSNHTPQRLEVITSDHSIQVIAQRRRAQAIDSDVWYERIATRTRRQPLAPPSPALGDHSTADDTSRSPSETADLANPFPPGYANEIPTREETWHPFPPGYGEDIDEHNLPSPARRRKRRRKG